MLEGGILGKTGRVQGLVLTGCAPPLSRLIKLSRKKKEIKNGENKE